MPIYEFKCKKCEHKFEALRLSSAGFKDVTCPKCGSKQVAKEMSSFAASVPSGGGSMPPMGGCGGGGCSGGMCGLN